MTLKIPRFKTLDKKLRKAGFEKICAVDTIDEVIKLFSSQDYQEAQGLRWLTSPGSENINELYIGPGKYCGENKKFVMYVRIHKD